MDNKPYIMARLWSYIPEILEKIQSKGYSRIAFFGNGQHSVYLHQVWNSLGAPPIESVLSSTANSTESCLPNIPLHSVSDPECQKLEAVVLSSQLYEQELYDTTSEHLPNVSIFPIHGSSPKVGVLTRALQATILKDAQFHILDIGAIDLFENGDGRPNYWPLIPNHQLALYCFEPDEEACQRLKSQAESRGLQVHVFPTAISNTEGTATLHVTKNRTGSSLFEPYKKRLDRYYYVEETLGETMRETGTWQVPVSTLDSIYQDKQIPLPDFIKMNIEGSEAAAILGGTLPFSHALGVQSELSFAPKNVDAPLFSDIDPLLRNAGYEFVDALAFNKYGRADCRLVSQDSGVVNHQRNGAVSAPRRQILEGHFLYLRELEQLSENSAETRCTRFLKQACIAEMYGQIEFAFSAARAAASAAVGGRSQEILDIVARSESYYLKSMSATPKQ